jgi:hypothetical protein
MTTANSLRVRFVWIYTGSITIKKTNSTNNKQITKTISGRFDCYTPEVQENELYELIDPSEPCSLPYNVFGKNIHNRNFFNSRHYHDD